MRFRFCDCGVSEETTALPRAQLSRDLICIFMPHTAVTIDRDGYSESKMTDRRGPTTAFWATVVVVVVLVAYPLSFGPACWVSCWMNAGQGAVTLIYRPITWTFGDSYRGREAVVGRLFQG